MPIYEYYCKRCKTQFESLTRPFGTVVCPKCKGVELDKLPAVVNYRIKGDNSSSTPKRKK